MLQNKNKVDEYTGNWITTYIGKKFHFLEPSEDEIDIRDIAHALALTCRFGGHCSKFYSVAQHSVLVSWQVSEKNMLAGLMHDAHEAYLHDVPRPIKARIAGYADIANNLQNKIQLKYKYTITNEDEIKWADDTLLSTEKRDLLTNTEDWKELPTPLEHKIYCWSPKYSEEKFLEVFKYLMDKNE